ncbi:hypothetical protein PTSG_12511 [Salpingoeca rosetta]|uniref:Vesicle-associated membrane protein 7 n=1 Tax=Salpingoeca rosetta (strain ATCC 50818 / BSB-021) TaxID=946362 RepID=F2UF85_SALR5|nr:uncharacterized protein PTSG_12511 [Salpingoeca rosetta]EGD75285.1 hypothetical protein PTSG_12511 [Salpingoeca rosetta]|eukprot:XP_004992338.1 hypothetical protein PTSG_12511 [Salpingoeca rosetta]
MSLIYALVARGNQILAEYTESSGNFTTVTQSILDKIPPQDQKCSYVYDKFLFHYVRDDGIVYLCMADESFGRRIPFAFLAQIQRDFLPYKSRARSSITYGLNRDFSPVLQRQMVSFNNSSEHDALSRARQEVDQVKGIMVQNIEKVLQRGEQIDLLVDKADTLHDEAKRFQRTSRKLKNQMWWQNKKMCLLITGVLLALALIIGLIIWSKTKKSGSNNNKTTTTAAPTTAPTLALSTPRSV